MYILYVCTCMYVHCVSSHVLGEESSRKGKTHPPASGKLPVEGEDVKKIKYSAELIFFRLIFFVLIHCILCVGTYIVFSGPSHTTFQTTECRVLATAA